MNSAATSIAPRPNRFPGPCRVCNTYVESGYGRLVGTPKNYGVLCPAHADGSAPTPSPAACKTVDRELERGSEPPCSDAAASLALALYRHACDDAEAEAATVALLREIAALALVSAGRSTDEIGTRDPRSDSLVSEILDRGSPQRSSAPAAPITAPRRAGAAKAAKRDANPWAALQSK